jgi:transitional endoplasmic reticulum ATPase
MAGTVVDELETLSRRLVRDPFDTNARRTYAERLLDAGAFDDSLEQWLILGKQLPGQAAPHLGAASCAARLGRTEETQKHLALARACSDFSADDPLMPEIAPAPTHSGGGLRAIDGGRKDPAPAPVIPISTKAGTRFIDVVGMRELKKLLKVRIVEPFVNPGLFQKFRRTAGGGVLLYGPPGCGKTLMARAIAGECKATFINVGISEIMSMWIGESERNLAALFEKARGERPSVLFFDELDALAFARSKAQSEHTRRLVNEFLSQLDGMSGNNDQILVLAATNMPWDVDSAMKRPGRFDRQIFVPPPDAEARCEMFRVKLHDSPVGAVDFEALAARTEHFSGADIDGVINRAKDEVLADIVEHGSERPLTQTDLLAVVEQTEPSTLDWLRTARNLVKFGGRDRSYKDIEKYLKDARVS